MPAHKVWLSSRLVSVEKEKIDPEWSILTGVARVLHHL
jgi:DNA-binding XRE family transcriptional regulator